MKNTKNDITEVVFILDRSGSMHHLTADTIGGFNSVIEQQKEGEGTVYVTTVLFNDSSFTLHDRINIKDVPEMTEKEYCTCGCTALIDALGDAIKHIEGIHKYIRPEDVPGKTLFMITTDGLENASHKYSSDEVKKMVSAKQEEGWEFIYFAANIDAVETAARYGIDRRNAVDMHNDSMGTETKFKAMNAAIRYKRTPMYRDCKLSEAPCWREEADKDFESRNK